MRGRGEGRGGPPVGAAGHQLDVGLAVVGEGRGGGGRHDRGAAQDMRSAAARSGEVSQLSSKAATVTFRIFAN